MWTRYRTIPLVSLIFMLFVFGLDRHQANTSDKSLAASPLQHSMITTVFLVRHAEKVQPPPGDSPDHDNPPLSDKGRARAQILSSMLSTAQISAIYISQYLRTEQTAAPVEKKLGIKAVSIPVEIGSDPGRPTDKYLKQITDEIYAHTGENLLIVGHDITVPAIIKALGSEGSFEIERDTYDDLFILTFSSKGTAKTIRLKYGDCAN